MLSVTKILRQCGPSGGARHICHRAFRHSWRVRGIAEGLLAVQLSCFKGPAPSRVVLLAWPFSDNFATFVQTPFLLQRSVPKGLTLAPSKLAKN